MTLNLKKYKVIKNKVILNKVIENVEFQIILTPRLSI